MQCPITRLLQRTGEFRVSSSFSEILALSPEFRLGRMHARFGRNARAAERKLCSSEEDAFGRLEECDSPP
ncbi:hypothetical protein WN51_02093 [Melipona quadrifasciata]|uniref:Uncharacterized protein n=1 Tax=Melipona quadrifasciata TaxID=166423 RepID=A0A0N0BF50_9HYME|nr:hypothetical protein WN51_02093 [Melipona quadrifasciata]